MVHKGIQSLGPFHRGRTGYIQVRNTVIAIPRFLYWSHVNSSNTVLVRTLDVAILCCSLAWINEMALPLSQASSCSSSSHFSSSAFSYFFPPGLAPKGRSPVRRRWMVSIPSSPAPRRTLSLYWAQGGLQWVPSCAHRPSNGWCPVRGSSLRSRWK